MTSHYRCRKLPVPLRLRLRQLAGAVFLVAVIALIPLFLWLQTRGRSTARFAGLVDAESETVGPVATARVLAIEVRPGQRVAPGDVLVRLEAPERAVDLAIGRASCRERV